MDVYIWFNISSVFFSIFHHIEFTDEIKRFLSFKEEPSSNFYWFDIESDKWIYFGEHIYVRFLFSSFRSWFALVNGYIQWIHHIEVLLRWQLKENKKYTNFQRIRHRERTVVLRRKRKKSTSSSEMSSDGGDGEDNVFGYLPNSVENYVSSNVICL